MADQRPPTSSSRPLATLDGTVKKLEDSVDGVLKDLENSGNPLAKAVRTGLVRKNQLLQTAIRSHGETETRIFDLPTGYQYAQQKGIQVGVQPNADYDGEEGGLLPADMILGSESRTNRMNIGALLERTSTLLPFGYAPLFTVAHNWHKALHALLGDVTDDLVALPFPACWFYFPYLEGLNHAVVSQDPDTREITVHSANSAIPLLSQEGGADYTVFKQHVLCACVAMEMGLANQGSVDVIDMGLPPSIIRTARAEYKVLPIKMAKGSKKPHNINTGRKGHPLHVRRSHWKVVKGVRKRIKWYFAGNIELGVIIKDYTVFTDLSEGKQS